MGIELLVRKGVEKQLKSQALKSQIRKTAKKLLSALGSEAVELSILLTDDSEMQELNKTYRGKDKTTDVLSFCLAEGEGVEFSGDQLGDVVISIPTAAAQAESLGTGLHEELLRLLIHGVLHLHGFEHESVPESVAKEMQEKEEQLYSLLLPEITQAN